MNTIIFLVLLLLSNLLVAAKGYKILLKSNSTIKFILYGVLYFLMVFMLAEMFNQINIYLRNKGYFIELGHASILGVEIWLFFQIISLIIILVCAFKKIRLRR